MIAKRARSLFAIALGLAATVAATATSAVAVGGGLATYQVTITDLTSGQPLTPPVVATHRRPFHVFEVGAPASFGVKEIAENGNLTPLVDALGVEKHVSAVVHGTAPLVPASNPGGTPFESSVTLTVTADRGAKYLSYVSMLICTNDGFTGVDSLRLPQRPGESVQASTAGYDGGTEINTEDFADIVPPCQGLIGVTSGDPGTGVSNPALAEGGIIHHHPGIQGGNDLVPAVHGWTDPVAAIVVTRVG